MRKSKADIRRELILRRDRYFEKKRKRSAILTGAGTTALVACFLGSIILLPGLLKRPNTAAGTPSTESPDFKEFWAEHQQQIVWDERTYTEPSEEDIPLNDPDLPFVSSISISEELQTALNQKKEYYAVQLSAYIHPKIMKEKVYEGKTLAEWLEIANADPSDTAAIHHQFPDEEKLYEAEQTLKACYAHILETYTAEGMTLRDLSAKVEELSLSAKYSEEEYLRLKTLLGEALDQAFADPIFDGKSYNDLAAELKELQEDAEDWEENHSTPSKEEKYQEHLDYREAYTAIRQAMLSDLLGEWGVTYCFNAAYSSYILFLTEEQIQNLSQKSVEGMNITLQLASYELNPLGEYQDQIEIEDTVESDYETPDYEYQLQEYAYDENGNLIRVLKYDVYSDGGKLLVEDIMREFDSQNKITAERYFDGPGNLLSYSLYSYESTGNRDYVMTVLTYDGNGIVDTANSWKYEYCFDKQGYTVDCHGENTHTESRFDSEGKRVSYLVYDREENEDSKEEYLYDENGKLILIRYSPESQTLECSYDEHGNIVTNKYLTAAATGFITRYTNEYDEKGRLSKVLSSTSDIRLESGEPVEEPRSAFTEEYTYTENGITVKVTKDDAGNITLYEEFDAVGNPQIRRIYD